MHREGRVWRQCATRLAAGDWPITGYCTPLPPMWPPPWPRWSLTGSPAASRYSLCCPLPSLTCCGTGCPRWLVYTPPIRPSSTAIPAGCWATTGPGSETAARTASRSPSWPPQTRTVTTTGRRYGCTLTPLPRSPWPNAISRWSASTPRIPAPLILYAEHTPTCSTGRAYLIRTTCQRNSSWPDTLCLRRLTWANPPSPTPSASPCSWPGCVRWWPVTPVEPGCPTPGATISCWPSARSPATRSNTVCRLPGCSCGLPQPR
jgi:hypothetical protein